MCLRMGVQIDQTHTYTHRISISSLLYHRSRRHSTWLLRVKLVDVCLSVQRRSCVATCLECGNTDKNVDGINVYALLQDAGNNISSVCMYTSLKYWQFCLRCGYACLLQMMLFLTSLLMLTTIIITSSCIIIINIIIIIITIAFTIFIIVNIIITTHIDYIPDTTCVCTYVYSRSDKSKVVE
jgi:hypothetical protein